MLLHVSKTVQQKGAKITLKARITQAKTEPVNEKKKRKMYTSYCKVNPWGDGTMEGGRGASMLTIPALLSKTISGITRFLPVQFSPN